MTDQDADNMERRGPEGQGSTNVTEVNGLVGARQTANCCAVSQPPPPGSVSLLARGAIWMVRQYQRWISPMLGQQCRFYPSCSRYYVGAVVKHGFWRGSLRGLWRLLRCNPFCRGGVDLP